MFMTLPSQRSGIRQKQVQPGLADQTDAVFVQRLGDPVAELLDVRMILGADDDQRQPGGLRSLERL